jgi:tRNA U34 2-thiouridine synthase MnmA/TrmU
MENGTEKITVHFNGKDYSVACGEVFQAYINNGVVGTEYIVKTENREQVHFELLEKLSMNTGLLRVTKIITPEIEQTFHEIIIDDLTEDEAKALNDMTKKELQQFAKEFGLDVNTKLKKKDLLEAIKKSI